MLVIYIRSSVRLRLSPFPRVPFMQHMALRFQLANFSFDDCDNICTSSYQQIGNMNPCACYSLSLSSHTIAHKHKAKKLIEIINYILDTLLGEYTHAQNKAKHNKHCAHTL